MRSRLKLGSACRLAVLLLALGAFCGTAAARDEPLKLVRFGGDNVSAMALSDDRTKLFTAHASENKVRVWDVATGKRVAETAVPTPYHLIQRGSDVYVACFDAGEIAVLPELKDWAVDRRIKLGVPRVFYLSAPVGEHFDDHLLATCHGRTGNMAVLVTLKGEGKARVVANLSSAAATCNGRGDLVYVQRIEGGTGHNSLVPLSRFLAGTTFAQLGTAMKDGEYAYQVVHSDRWYAGRFCLDGLMDDYEELAAGGLIVPDSKAPVHYRLFADNLSAAPRSPGSIPGDRPVQIPAELRGYLLPSSTINGVHKPLCRFVLKGDRPASVSPPAAATVDGRLYVFLYVQELGAVYRGETNAFGETDVSRVPPKPVDGDLPDAGETLTPVPTAKPVLAMTLSEDGRMFAAAREERVLIWDIASRRLLSQLPVPQPGSMMWRGDRLFVIEREGNSVREYDTRTFRLAHTHFLTDAPGMSLAAPRGKAFNGMILVATSDSRVAFLDTAGKRDWARYKRGHLGGVSVSADGATVIEQGNFAHSPAGAPEQFDAKAYWSGNIGIARSPQHIHLGPLHQPRPGPYWFDHRMIYSGNPIDVRAPAGHGWSSLAPDVTRDMFYAVTKDRVVFHRLDDKLTAVDRRPVKMPDAMLETISRGGSIAVASRPDWSQPQAAVVGDHLHLFFSDFVGTVYHYKTKAEVRTPNSGAAPAVVGSPAGNGRQENLLLVGRPAAYPLPSRTPGAVYTIVSGPAGATVSGDGVLHWAPSRADVGEVRIKVRVEAAGSTTFDRLVLTVRAP